MTQSHEPAAAPLSPAAADSLRAQAHAVAAHAYAPYSHFRVGAAILLEDGSIFTGCNVENASFRLTVCAEQTAIVAAVASRGPGIRIRAVAVANLNGASSMPCGACRQTIAEFASPATWIYGPGADGPVDLPFAELLPHGFRLDPQPASSRPASS